ncbi:hypothetical protein [Streptomyces silvensis]|uniref:Uncharacterized protein n=1 Tax=Streptomyces silvensis TaxID=1765722 RepID=A0A0W7X8F2_9ACTN|nr:hypothetical protein [Streptomyces silvensis]KUF18835.1 hypothetical protein AT728_07315 [Streptomyces silvensis]
MAKSIDEHAAAIEAAVWAARADGFELTDDDGEVIWRAELWEFREGQITDDFRLVRMPTESLEDA